MWHPYFKPAQDILSFDVGWKIDVITGDLLQLGLSLTEAVLITLNGLKPGKIDWLYNVVTCKADNSFAFCVREKRPGKNLAVIAVMLNKNTCNQHLQS